MFVYLFYVISGIMVLLAFLLGLMFYNPVRRMKNALRKTRRQLEREAKIQENATFFLKDGYQMFSNRTLKNLWERYLFTINHFKGQYQYVDINEYFSPEKTLMETTNTALASFVPVIIFINGITLTSAALLYYKWTSQITEKYWIQAIAVVLSLTFLSLLFGVYYKNLVFATKMQFSLFCQMIASNHQSMSGLSEQLGDLRYTMQSYNKEQLKFYASLTDHIAENTRKSIEPFLLETSATIDSFVAATTERQIETMQKLAEYFADTTTQLYLDQISKISKTTEDMAEIQTQTAQTLQAVTSIYTESKDCILQVTDESSKVLNRYDDHLTHVKEMNAALIETVRQLEDLVEYIRNNSRNQNFTIENLTRFQKDLMDVSDKSVTSMQQFFDDFKDQYSSSIIALRAASNDMLKSGELLKDSYSGLATDVNLEIGRVFQTFEENLATISVHISQSVHDLQEAIDELPEVMRRINTDRV